jgi:polyisoprenoid-binding protein YceI
MRKLLFALPLLVAAPMIIHHSVQAAGPWQMGPDARTITGGRYTVDGLHTLVGWRVNHLFFNDYFGIFGNMTGELNLDKDNPAKSSVSIEIPISGLVTASEKLSGHMKSKDFFDAERFPTAKFVSTNVKVNKLTAVITGNLTILGVTKPVRLSANLSGNGPNLFKNKVETVGFHAKTSINRSEWGMTYGVPGVADKVDLEITAAFEKTP